MNRQDEEVSEPFLAHHNDPRSSGITEPDDSFDLERFPQYEVDSDSDNHTTVVGRVRNCATRIRLWASKFAEANMGIGYLLMSQLFGSVMALSSKMLETDPDNEPLHPFEILSIRMTITLVVCVYVLKYKMKVDSLLGPKEVRGWLLVRGLVGFINVFSTYYSVMYISLADSSTIKFLTPSLSSFMAWVLLGEHWTLVEAGGSLVSFVGVVLIARPTFLGFPQSQEHNGAETSDPKQRALAIAVALVGVLGGSTVYITLKKIGKGVNSFIVVEVFTFVVWVISLCGLVLDPNVKIVVPSSVKQWVLLVVLGFTGFYKQFLLTEGVKSVKISKGSLVIYTQVVFSLFWDFTIWHHLPNIWSWLGVVIIVGSTVVVLSFKEANQANRPGDIETGASELQELPGDTELQQDPGDTAFVRTTK